MSGAVGGERARKVVRLYTGFQFFFSLLLWLPVFYEYQKKIGLGDAEIFAIQSVYYVVFCVLEIPTGAIADRWGHRQCMKAGATVLAAANLVAIFVQSYAGFLAHFLMIALARSLVSGASSAYLYDFLKSEGKTPLYKEAEGNARALSLIGQVVGWAGIGVAMQWHLTLPYWLTALSSLLAALLAWRLPRLAGEGQRADGGGRSGWLRQLAPVFGLLSRSPVLGVIVLQGIALFVLARICMVNLFQPILGEKAFGVASFGLIMSATTVFEALGARAPGLLRRLVDDMTAVLLLSALVGVCVLAVPFAGKAGTVASLALCSLAFGLSFPIQKQLLNDAIPDSSYRATVLSIESLVDRAVCAAVAAEIGSFMKQGRMDAFLEAAGLATLAVVGLLALGLLLGRRRLAAPAVVD